MKVDDLLLIRLKALKVLLKKLPFFFKLLGILFCKFLELMRTPGNLLDFLGVPFACVWIGGVFGEAVLDEGRTVEVASSSECNRLEFDD